MKGFLCAIAGLFVSPLILLSGQAAAQRTATEADRQRQAEENRRRENARRLDDMAKEHQAVLRRAELSQGDANFFNKKLTEAQKKLIEPAAEDQAAYREFLRQERTGLIRLLPRGKYEFSETVAADSPDLVLPIRGGGAFYSFAEKKHSLGPWSEITLQEGRLIVGFFGQSLGLMTALGDVPLESVTLATPGANYLAQLLPPTQSETAREQRNRNFQGFSVGGHHYNANLPARVNQTYVLRSTVYKKEGRMLVVPGGGAVYVPHPHEYGGADELIAFRVLRASPDGSLTILWKRLQKYTPPKIKPQMNTDDRKR